MENSILLINKEITKEHNKTNNIMKKSTNKVSKELNTVEKRTLDKFKIRRYCCRRMLLTHVDMCEKI